MTNLDAENFAEYCGIILLLCVGLLLFDRGIRRSVLLAVGTAVVAVYSGAWCVFQWKAMSSRRQSQTFSWLLM